MFRSPCEQFQVEYRDLTDVRDLSFLQSTVDLQRFCCALFACLVLRQPAIEDLPLDPFFCDARPEIFQLALLGADRR